MAGNPQFTPTPAPPPTPVLDPWPPLDAPRLEYALAWSKRNHDPIPLDGKRPVDLDWPNILFAKNLTLHFAISKRNVGIALGKNGLTDIDLDLAEAIILWREFFGLPTKCVYGRDKKAYSHCLYIISQGIPSIRYQYKVPDQNTGELKARTILELRCLSKQGTVGAQSMVPNSIHPTSKERIRFENGLDGEPSPADANELSLAVAKTAAAILLFW